MTELKKGDKDYEKEISISLSYSYYPTPVLIQNLLTNIYFEIWDLRFPWQEISRFVRDSGFPHLLIFLFPLEESKPLFGSLIGGHSQFFLVLPPLLFSWLFRLSRKKSLHLLLYTCCFMDACLFPHSIHNALPFCRVVPMLPTKSILTLPCSSLV